MCNCKYLKFQRYVLKERYVGIVTIKAHEPPEVEKSPSSIRVKVLSFLGMPMDLSMLNTLCVGESVVISGLSIDDHTSFICLNRNKVIKFQGPAC